MNNPAIKTIGQAPYMTISFSRIAHPCAMFYGKFG